MVGLNKWAVLVFVAVFACLTYLVLSNIQRFETVDILIEANSPFINWQDRWVVKGKSVIRVSESNLEIVNSGKESAQLVQYRELDGAGFLRLTGELGARNISLDHHSWAGGALAITYFDENGVRVRQKAAVRLLSDSPMEKYEYVERIDEEVKKIGVSIRLLRASGSLSVRSVTLTRLNEVATYKAVKVVLASAWLILLLYGLFRGFRTLTRRNFLFVSGFVIITLMGLLAPKELTRFTTQQFELIMSWVPWFSATNPLLGDFFQSLSTIQNSTFAHFFIFFVCGIYSGYRLRQFNDEFAICGLLVFAFVTEVLQMFVEGRSSNLVDFSADAIGALFGAIVGVLLVRKRR